MATKWLVLYLLSGFSVALLSAFLTSYATQHSSSNSTLPFHYGSESSSTDTVWPVRFSPSLCLSLCLMNILLYLFIFSIGQKLKFSWKLVLATVIGFLGSAFGTVGGVGGGGIFVPMLTLIIGFDTKSAAALSKCNFSVPLLGLIFPNFIIL